MHFPYILSILSASTAYQHWSEAVNGCMLLINEKEKEAWQSPYGENVGSHFYKKFIWFSPQIAYLVPKKWNARVCMCVWLGWVINIQVRILLSVFFLFQDYITELIYWRVYIYTHNRIANVRRVIMSCSRIGLNIDFGVVK